MLKLTLRWCKEVEERVVLHGLHNGALRPTSFVLLDFLYDFHRHVLAFLPVDCAPGSTTTTVLITPGHIIDRYQSALTNSSNIC